MNFVNYKEFIEDIKNFIETLPIFSEVSYIPKSGMIPAYIYSKRYNVPIVSLKNAKNSEKTLIFDDSVYHGRRIRNTQKVLSESKYAVIYYVYRENEGIYKLDYKFKQIPFPRIFEWNWINEEYLINTSCFDIDGVLCYSPKETEGQFKDYIDFLENVKPKYVPKHTIGCIVTARVEKYREQTENWLKKHNIKYNKLIMLNTTEEERRSKGLHTINKIEEYSKSDYNLFIEDEIYQAELISKNTGKAVLCVTDWKIY